MISRPERKQPWCMAPDTPWISIMTLRINQIKTPLIVPIRKPYLAVDIKKASKLILLRTVKRITSWLYPLSPIKGGKMHTKMPNIEPEDIA